MNTPDAVPFHSSPSRLTRSLAGYARLAVGLLALASAHAALAFGFNDVAVRAKQLATKPYQAPTETLPRQLRELRYDQYREIRFKSDQAYWRRDKLPFELGFFHEGSYYDQPVKINEVSPAGVREIRFDPRLFDYGPVKLDAKQLQHLGFAGFRVHYAMNTPKYKDEVIVFLGASYFRAIGKNQVYGLSARGLAIDTALNSGEEFPRFTDFWIERPAANAKELTVYALLNSRRATGAYRFVIKPGTDTVVDVKAQVYMRENVSKLAIAPLTSMFFFGENQPAANLDFRPEVHDSDGLSVLSGTGEWIWRPLTNPKRLLVSSFSTTNPGGFGLMQRDRAFSSYEEIGDRYEQRPSTWIEPVGKWGAGRVELVQIPTPDETNDNVVAYWVPETQPDRQRAVHEDQRRRDADLPGRERQFLPVHCVAPVRSRPASMRQCCWPMRAACSGSCVIHTQAHRSGARAIQCCSSASMARAEAGSRAAVGSSSSSTAGSVCRVRTSAAICASPPERSVAVLSRKLASRSARASMVMAASRSNDACP